MLRFQVFIENEVTSFQQKCRWGYFFQPLVLGMALTFGNGPHLWALPIVKHDVNFNMILNMPDIMSDGRRRVQFLHLLLQSRRNFILVSSTQRNFEVCLKGTFKLVNTHYNQLVCNNKIITSNCK
jgi:hypothetical protein